MWTKITRYWNRHRLISVPVRPASEPVVVRQTLDGTQCGNCNILHRWKRLINEVKQEKEIVTWSNFLLFLGSYPIVNEPVRNTFYGACINSIYSCKQFSKRDSATICKQLQPNEIWGIGLFYNSTINKKAGLVSRPHQSTKTSIRPSKGGKKLISDNLSATKICHKNVEKLSSLFNYFFPKHIWAMLSRIKNRYAQNVII